MISDAVKIARSQERIALINAMRDVFTNPAVVALGGVVLVEYLQSSEQDGRRVAGGGWMGSAVGTTIEAGLIAYMASNSVQKITGDLQAVASAVAPLLLTKGAV